MYTKIIILLWSCVGCGLEQIEYKFDQKYTFCCDMGDVIREDITTHYWEYEGDPAKQGYYTDDGKLFVGVMCE